MRPCYSFLRREGVLEICHLAVFLFHQCIYFALSASYVTDDTGEGAPELISDLLGPDTFLM